MSFLIKKYLWTNRVSPVSTMSIALNNRELKPRQEINGNILDQGIYNISGLTENGTDATTPHSLSHQDPVRRENENSRSQPYINHSFSNKLLLCFPGGALVIPAFFILLAYSIADLQNTLELPPNSNVPYISDVGNGTPQSSIFTFGLNLSAFFTLAIILTRYYQVKNLFVRNDRRTNAAGLAVGLLFVLGTLIVSSFQVRSVTVVHFIGAGLYVVFATIYAGIQSFISYKNRQVYQRGVVVLIRIVLTFGMVAGGFLFLIFLIPSLHKYNRINYSVAQGSEWCWAACKVLFMLSFVEDFWRLEPVFFVRVIDKRTQSRIGLEYVVQNPDTTPDDTEMSGNNSNEMVISEPSFSNDLNGIANSQRVPNIHVIPEVPEGS